jgi:hypothetical protein
MRILLLGLTGAEPAFAAWDDCLTRAGVPFDAVACEGGDTPVAVVDETGDARYQGLIVVSGGVVDAALQASQRAELQRLERELGLRTSRGLRRWSPGPISQHCWASTIGPTAERRWSSCSMPALPRPRGACCGAGSWPG